MFILFMSVEIVVVKINLIKLIKLKLLCIHVQVSYNKFCFIFSCINAKSLKFGYLLALCTYFWAKYFIHFFKNT